MREDDHTVIVGPADCCATRALKETPTINDADMIRERIGKTSERSLSTMALLSWSLKQISTCRRMAPSLLALGVKPC
jgi:hypothetical protein